MGDDEATELRDLVAGVVGDSEPGAVVYRETVEPLEDPRAEWTRSERLADLPGGEVDGWDELYVYTDTHVYRWVGVGFDRGPDRLPRDPDHLPGGG